MSELFETSEVDAAEEIVRTFYSSQRLRTRGERVMLRVERQRLGGVRLDHTVVGMRLDYQAAALGELCVARHRDGGATYNARGRVAGRRRGDVFVPSLPDVAYDGTVDHVDGDVATFDPGLLDEIAAGAPGSTGTVQVLDVDPVSALAAARWHRAYDAVHALAGGPDEPPPLVATQAARFLAAVTLDTFPSTALLEPTAVDRHDAHPDTVRRAIAFMEQDPQRDLTAADIAAAAHVSLRAVQLAFRRHLDTTPMAHLRRLRLEGARDELLARSPRHTTVTAVAARWGFASASAFAARYRDAFGEPPSRTLTR